MNKYESPCGKGECDFLPGIQADSTLCDGMAKTLVSAGASSIFEATKCPFEAAQIIAAKDTERTAELSEKLGIIGLVRGGDI